MQLVETERCERLCHTITMVYADGEGDGALGFGFSSLLRLIHWQRQLPLPQTQTAQQTIQDKNQVSSALCTLGLTQSASVCLCLCLCPLHCLSAQIASVLLPCEHMNTYIPVSSIWCTLPLCWLSQFVVIRSLSLLAQCMQLPVNSIALSL